MHKQFSAVLELVCPIWYPEKESLEGSVWFPLVKNAVLVHQQKAWQKMHRNEHIRWVYIYTCRYGHVNHLIKHLFYPLSQINNGPYSVLNDTFGTHLKTIDPHCSGVTEGRLWPILHLFSFYWCHKFTWPSSTLSPLRLFPKQQTAQMCFLLERFPRHLHTKKVVCYSKLQTT